MIENKRIRLDPFPLEALRLVREQRLAEFARAFKLDVPADWPTPDVATQQIPVQIQCLDAKPAELPWHGRLIVLKPNTLVGNINLKGPPDMAGRVEIGYEVLPGYRRRGLAFEAAQLLTAWCFTQPGVRAVVARTKPDNEASASMLIKLGFEHIGREHDAVIGEMLIWKRARD